MKKKIFSKAISFTLVIAMLSSFATISAFAESKNDVETNQEAISAYSNDVAGTVLRYVFFVLLYNANPSFTSTLNGAQLTRISILTDNKNFSTITAQFFTSNLITKIYIDVNLIVATKEIWAKSINISSVDKYIVLNALRIILDTLTAGAVGSPEATDYINKQINGHFANISSANAIKNAFTQARNGDQIICVPTVMYNETFLGIIKEPRLETPCYTSILRNGASAEVPNNVTAPSWVNNGAPVTYYEV